MKKLYTLILASVSICCGYAQTTTVYGTFLPVNGTVVKEVWDTTTNVWATPLGGASNMTWDYSSVFQKADTFDLATQSPTKVNATIMPNSASKSTNAVFVRAVKKAKSADSLHLFYKIGYDGFYLVGAFDEKTNIGGLTKLSNNPYEVSDPELVVPFEVIYGGGNTTPVIKDTLVAQSNFNVAFFGSVRHKLVRIKTMSCEGAGTLKTPVGSFENTILTKEIVVEYDTVFGAGNAVLTKFSSSFTRYNFIRNNTFASSVLMFIQDNNGDNKSDLAWITLPTKFGSINGAAWDSSGTSKLTQGTNEVWLYRDHNNFTKNDVLAKTQTDASGNYKFDSIPYGYYLIAVRPDPIKYPNSLTTYYGDTSKTSSSSWMNADTINTIDCECNVTGKDIKIKYSAPQGNNAQLGGQITVTFPFVNMPPVKTGGGKGETSVMTTGSVDGIDIIVRKKPGGNSIAQTTTDNSGNFGITSLNAGNYDLFVDVPGLGMSGTYAFTVTNSNTTLNCLDFTIYPDSISPNNTNCIPLSAAAGKRNEVGVNIYPNPFSTNSQVVLDLLDKSNVLIELYNCIGQKISVIENSVEQAGSHSYSLNDLSAKPAGIYFVHIKTSEGHKTIKIIRE